MIRFTKKIFIFILIPVLLYVLFFFITKIKFEQHLKSYPIIILGDSQTEFIHHSKVYNRSIQGSPYFVHYEFAKEFIEALKQKKVYVAYNYHNLSKLYQNRLENDSLLPGWGAAMINHLNDYTLLNQKHEEIRPTWAKFSLFNNKTLPNLVKTTFFPKNEKNESYSLKDTTVIANAIYKHWTDPRYVLNDIIQKEYFFKLIDLLEKNNCEIILLKMPLTSYYKDNIPTAVKSEYVDLTKKHAVTILDLDQKISISKKYKYFKDYGHLNVAGDSLVIDYLIKHELNEEPSNVNSFH